jgi:PAS domain S-box-containing protein
MTVEPAVEKVSATGAALDPVLLRIVEGTAAETGEPFLAALVRNLAVSLGTVGAWVAELDRDGGRLRALAFWLRDGWVTGYEYNIAGTPCRQALETKGVLHIPTMVATLFPGDNDLGKLNAVGYMGVRLEDPDGAVLGLLAVLDDKPMPPGWTEGAIFRVFAARAGAELCRLRLERALRQTAATLSALIEGAMDGILVLDVGLRVLQANPAARRLFGAVTRGRLTGVPLAELLDEPSRHEFEQLRMRAGDEAPLWLPGNLTAVGVDGRRFPVEATFSRIDAEGPARFTLILRDLGERLLAEQRLQQLATRAAYLEDELRAECGPGGLIGRSAAMEQVIREIREVAATEASVLIEGETGTGKELIARAIHESSPRHDQALVRVNCAAIPPNLLESEFFGHEKGAFTGATARREGRFSLADGGTLFLDEIGELPLELQPKLLRALQEGEFEPVGSSRTRKVNVRLIAATHRDLLADAAAGRFREDLYYRIAVYPIRVPPLRERGDDIGLLAGAFAEHAARRCGKPVPMLDADSFRRLKAYSWPGNVRELANVIERAVIIGSPGRLNLDRALPEARGAIPTATGAEGTPEIAPIYSDREWRELERANLTRALHACHGKIAGPRGAAARLGVSPSTLASRLKALGVRREAPSG